MTTPAMTQSSLAEILRAFAIPGSPVSAVPHGNGHINHSFCASFEDRGTIRHYLLQRINTAIFHDLAALMENIERVTEHLATKGADASEADRRVLTLVRTHDGTTWHRDGNGGTWRVFNFVENTRSYEFLRTPAQAYETARAFGAFQARLADLSSPRLHETLPGFHDTPRRFRDFETALAADSHHRVTQLREEIAFAFARKNLCGLLLDAGLPERVTHNDAKLNNLLFDAATDETLCVVDLDTVMPGLALYDFGDMVRTATSPTAEDEQDLAQVNMRFPMFEALVRGYLHSAGSFLTRAERALLPFAGKLIAFEQGIRFLTDYLSGDTYYKVSRPGQNLDRCRTQFRLTASLEAQEDAMQRLVESV